MQRLLLSVYGLVVAIVRRFGYSYWSGCHFLWLRFLNIHIIAFDEPRSIHGRTVASEENIPRRVS